jgi:hypothetical protein
MKGVIVVASFLPVAVTVAALENIFDRTLAHVGSWLGLGSLLPPTLRYA